MGFFAGQSRIALLATALLPATAFAAEPKATEGRRAPQAAKVVRSDAEAHPKPPELTREELKREIAKFGMIALLDESRVTKGRETPAPAWSRVALPGSRSPEAMWIGTVGDAFDPSGLGLSGTGEEGGAAEGVAASDVATVGRGQGLGSAEADRIDGGRGRLANAYTMHTPRNGVSTILRHLPPDAIQRVVHLHFGRFRMCYEDGLRNNPALEGRVAVRFTIDRGGAVSTAADGGSDLPDPDVVSCVVRTFANLPFPASGDRTITVVYPLVFSRARP